MEYVIAVLILAGVVYLGWRRSRRKRPDKLLDRKGRRIVPRKP